MASSSLPKSSDSDAHRAPHDTALGETTDPAGSQAGNDNSVVDPPTKVVLGSRNADQDTIATAPPSTSSAGNDNLAVVGHNKVVLGACSTYQGKGKTTARASSRARNDNAVVDTDNKVALRSCNTGKGKGKAAAPASSSAGDDYGAADPNNKGVQGSPNADLDMDIPGVTDVGNKVVPVLLKSDGDCSGEVAGPTADPCTSPVLVNSTGNVSRASANDNTTPRADLEAANLNHGANVPAEQPGDGANNDIAVGHGQDNSVQGQSGATSPNDNPGQEVDQANDTAGAGGNDNSPAGAAIQIRPTGQPGPETGGTNNTAQGNDYTPIRSLAPGSDERRLRTAELYQRRLQSNNPGLALQIPGDIAGYPAKVYWGTDAPELTVKSYLGMGAGGNVYLVEDGDRVAWALKLSLRDNDIDRGSWQWEAFCLDALHGCVAVPQMKGAWSAGPFLYLQLELCDMGDLESVVSTWGHSVGLGLGVARDVLFALAHAHDQGLVHHDVKPQNVFGKSGTKECVLGDWGLASRASFCGEGQLCGGTVGYMPPEIVQRRRHTEKVDLFGTGGTFKWTVDGVDLVTCYGTRAAAEAAVAAGDLDAWFAAAVWGTPAGLRSRAIIELMCHRNPVLRPTAQLAFDWVSRALDQFFPRSGSNSSSSSPPQPANDQANHPDHANADEPADPVDDSPPTVPADLALPPPDQPQPTDPADQPAQLDLVAVILEGTAQQLEALNQTHEPTPPAHTVPAEPQDTWEPVVDLGEPTAPVVNDSQSPVLTVPTAAPTELADATSEPLNPANPTEPLHVAEVSFEAVFEPLEANAEQPVVTTEPVEDNQPGQTLENPTQPLEATANSTELVATQEEPLTDAHPTEPLQVANEPPVANAGQLVTTADLAQTAQTEEPAQGTDTLEIPDPTLEVTDDLVQPAADAPDLAAEQLQDTEPDDPADATQDVPPAEADQDVQPDEPDHLVAPSQSSEPAAADATATAPTANPAQGTSVSTPGHGSTVATGPGFPSPAGTAAPALAPTTITAQGVASDQGVTPAPAPVSTSPAVIIAPAPDDDLLHDLVFTDYLDVLRQLEPGAVDGGLGVGTATQHNGGPSVQVGATRGQGGPSVQANGGNGHGNGNGNGNAAGVVYGGGGSAQGSASTTTTEGFGAPSSLYCLTHQMATNFVEEAVMIDTVSGCESYDVVRPKKRNVFKRAAHRLRGAFRRLKCT